MHPCVSVIIPTYNRALKVRHAIESVLSQNIQDLEVIVVDDGSSDGTGRMLFEQYGDRIRYFAQANQGVSVARNKGIAEAQGKWIAFLDSDDIWDQDKLEWQLRALDRFSVQCGGCYTDTRLMNHSETRTLFELAEKSYRHEELMGINTEVLRLLVRPGGAGMVVCPSTLLARADDVRKAGGFNPKLRFSEDSEFLFRLALKTGFCYVNRPLVQKDQAPPEVRHVGVSSEWNKLEFVLDQSRMRLEGLLRISDGVSAPVKRLLREQLAFSYSGLANCYLDARQYAKARRAVSNALRFNRDRNFIVKYLLTWMSPRLARRTVLQRLNERHSSLPVI